MAENVWKLHRPKRLLSLTTEAFLFHTHQSDKWMGIQLHPSTAYYQRSEGQSEIANKAVEQYLCHFVCYRQDDWALLLAMAKFNYKTNDHISTGVSPF